ncbi:hypothetical protein ACJJTC_008062 [Scirpophaga incertulas]
MNINKVVISAEEEEWNEACVQGDVAVDDMDDKELSHEEHNENDDEFQDKNKEDVDESNIEEVFEDMEDSATNGKQVPEEFNEAIDVAVVRCRRVVVRPARVLRKCILNGGEGDARGAAPLSLKLGARALSHGTSPQGPHSAGHL